MTELRNQRSFGKMRTLVLSHRQVLVGKKICKRHLKEGTGDPCAGQPRLNGVLDSSLRLELVSFTENFGLDPPTGSKT